MAAEAAGLPIGWSEAGRLFGALDPARGLALAVSGGADSVALMRLAADWRQRVRPDLHTVVFTVDHGLRPESGGEARQVARWADALGLAHETLVWTGDKPCSGLQEAARSARYGLMARRCAELGLTHLATAHHLDDQAETLLMRLSRGSGLDGLAAMAPTSRLHGPVLLRPFLDMPKARLLATLQALGQPWLEDVSNQDERFARARLRRIMPLLAVEGLTSGRLAQAARRFARARAALDAAAAELHRDCVADDPAGFCRLDLRAFAAAPEEIGLRLLARMVTAVAGTGAPPRLHRLERLHTKLLAYLDGAVFRGATLGGCRVMPAGEAIVIFRERGRADLPALELAPQSAVLWDGRFHVRLRGLAADRAVVRPLGAEGLGQLRRESRPRVMPSAAARVSAAVFVGDRLFAAPHMETAPGRFSPAGVEVEFIGGARLDANAA